MKRLFLLRYDTEHDQPQEMAGFLETAVAVHKEHAIPATFFCRGGALDARESDFLAFHRAVRGNPLFDLQDHSYTHIGIGYAAGKPVEVIRADYERSFAAHERLFGVRPIGVSYCGTSCDGAQLSGFDATPKSRAEFEMLIGLGVRFINTFLTGHDESSEFINFAALGHPEVMGFPSGFSDTDWMHQHNHGEPVAYIKGLIDERAGRGQHLAVVLHDWCAWNFAGDKELTHVKIIADHARSRGFELAAHAACYHNAPLWQ